MIVEKQKKAVYVLSADPMHYGHVQNLRGGMEFGNFDKVYVGIGVNSDKKYLFDKDQKVSLAKKTLEANGFNLDKIVVETFEGLARNYAARKGAKYIIRGSRNPTDFAYERELADYHEKYGLTTVVVPATKETQGMSSTMAKAIAKEGGMTHEYVHPMTKQALEEKLRGYSLVGVTGNMGAGKTTFCKNLTQYAVKKGMEVNHLDFDRLVHSLYYRQDGLGEQVRDGIKEEFGEDLFEKDNLNRKKLAGIVFGDDDKRQKLAEILMQPAVMALEDTLRDMKGIVLVDAAYMTEYNMLPLVNNNVVLVNCNEEERLARILKRDGITKEQLEERVKAQQSYEVKKKNILEKQEKDKFGFFYEVDTTEGLNEADYESLFQKLNTNFPLFK